MPVIDWYYLWKKGVLHPKGGQELLPNSAFGTPGVPKIVFAGDEASRTGASLILLRLMEAIQARTGAELYLILEKSGPLLADYQRIAHVLVDHSGMLHYSTGQRVASLLDSIASPRAELAICNSAGSWRLVQVLREAGLRAVVTLIRERVDSYPAEVWNSIHAHSSHILFPAEAVKAETAGLLPIFSDAGVLPQGLLNPEFGQGDRTTARLEVRRQLGLSPQATVILGCGMQDMRKGTDLFVQLSALVRARTKREIHFVWLGARNSESLFSNLLELDLGLLDERSIVSLLDEVADPEPYFLAADAFVLTSRDDPFPCVLHEAMACALPVVVFDGADGAKEALPRGSGIVVPYLDLQAMARALTPIIEQPFEYALMGQLAQARARSVYRFSDYAERIWEICQAQLDALQPRLPVETGPASIHTGSRSTPAPVPETGTVKRPSLQPPAAERKPKPEGLFGKIGQTIRAMVGR